MAFGVQFLPGEQEGGYGTARERTGARRSSPVQEAIRILSLRLPKFYGSQSMAPAPLLRAPGGMGQPGAKGNVTAQALAQWAGVPGGDPGIIGGDQVRIQPFPYPRTTI